MAGVTIRVEGTEPIRARFAQAPRIIDALLRQAGRDIIQVGISRLAYYPTPRPGQRYRRTGRYGRGWTDSPIRFGVGAGGITMFKRNTVPYASFVGGERQVWFHANRWANINQAQALMERAAPARLAQAAEQAAKSLGG